MAFRMAYSILDKIAYFLNHYLALGIPEKRISFRTIWREKDNGPVRDRFAKSENWPLRGLFWLSKDLFEENMRDSTEPEARAVAELRNHLEHKYVKVHEMLLPPMSVGDPFHDTLAYTITRSDLERRTLRLMQLARSALIYLSLGMHREERQRAKGKKGLTATMSLDPLRDEWKR
jgi:LA2681-like HEPN